MTVHNIVRAKAICDHLAPIVADLGDTSWGDALIIRHLSIGNFLGVLAESTAERAEAHFLLIYNSEGCVLAVHWNKAGNFEIDYLVRGPWEGEALEIAPGEPFDPLRLSAAATATATAELKAAINLASQTLVELDEVIAAGHGRG